MKKAFTPSKNCSNKINPPKSLIPIIKAFKASSNKTIKTFVNETSQFFFKEKLQKDELKNVIALIKNLRPKNMIETIYASQFIILYIIGMRKITAIYPEDQKISFKFFKLSNKLLQKVNM
jgi:hypothetical protein